MAPTAHQINGIQRALINNGLCQDGQQSRLSIVLANSFEKVGMNCPDDDIVAETQAKLKTLSREERQVGRDGQGALTMLTHDIVVECYSNYKNAATPTVQDHNVSEKEKANDDKDPDSGSSEKSSKSTGFNKGWTNKSGRLY